MDSLIEKIELQEAEKAILVKAYRILADITDDMYAEDLEDTEDNFKAENAKNDLRQFLDYMGVDYSD